MGAVERAILEAYHPCKDHRGLLWEMRRRVRILAFQYSVTVGTSVMLAEEAICVHIFLLLLLASIGYGLYAQCHPLMSSIAG
ncbi:g8031 [Coccomyxa viridis]|uniref:G8031 protein n=1 Tax=Coccomyxa viridis TaxID=1274662 RepID=A0ABP1G637_9CHLO